MVILYHGGGAGDFELLDEWPPESYGTVLNRITRPLKTKGNEVAVNLLKALSFSIWNATNYFGDEFQVMHAELPSLEYEALKSLADTPEIRNAARLIAKLVPEYWPDASYIRFVSVAPAVEPTDRWDIFICHASADKETVARPLAQTLDSVGFNIWLDEYELKAGDSLGRKIDQGLANSKYGVVILSESFFSRDWPQRELGALRAKESDQSKAILPVWHGVDKRYILKYSPLLADRVALNTADGVPHLADQLIEVVAPTLGLIRSLAPNRNTDDEPW